MKYTIITTQHSGMSEFSQQDCLWNGRHLIQRKNNPASSFQHDKVNFMLSVADGVSISPSPHLASKFITKSLVDVFDIDGHINARTIRTTHSKLCDKYAKGRTLGSAATIAVADFNSEKCNIYNVGDSRIYLIDKSGKIHLLSHDHTIIDNFRVNGIADVDEEYSQLYDALEHCLIADDNETDFPIHHTSVTLSSGDAIVLCTDGVHDTLSEAQLNHIFKMQLKPIKTVEAIRKAVIDAGSPDNFSLVYALYE